jgi:hypothetical protein
VTYRIDLDGARALVVCDHPCMERTDLPGGYAWRKRRTGRRWKLERSAYRRSVLHRCPDCGDCVVTAPGVGVAGMSPRIEAR